MEEFGRQRNPDELDDALDTEEESTDPKTPRVVRGFSSLFKKEELPDEQKDRAPRFPILAGLFEKEKPAKNKEEKEDDSTSKAVDLEPATGDDTVTEANTAEVTTDDPIDTEVTHTTAVETHDVTLSEANEGEIWTPDNASGTTQPESDAPINLEGNNPETPSEISEASQGESLSEDSGENLSDLDNQDDVEAAQADEGPEAEEDQQDQHQAPQPIIPPIPTRQNTSSNTQPSQPPQPPQAPPTQPTVTPSPAPAPPVNPNIVNPQPINPNVSPSTPISSPNVIYSQGDIDDAEARGTRRGSARSALLGLAVGFVLGRRGKKGLKKEINASNEELKKQAEEIKRLHDEQERAKAEFTKLARDTEQHTNEFTLEKPADVLKRVFIAGQIAKEQAPAGAESRARVRYEIDDRGNLTIERSDQQKSKEAQAKVFPELDQYEVPNDRRVEMSSWHRIEVDKKTGQIVENPSLEYGEEFKYEQKQERSPKDNTKQVGALPVGAVVSGASTGFSDFGISDDNNQSSRPQSTKKDHIKEIARSKTQDILRYEPVTQIAVPFFLASGIILFILLVLYLLFAL